MAFWSVHVHRIHIHLYLAQHRLGGSSDGGVTTSSGSARCRIATLEQPGGCGRVVEEGDSLLPVAPADHQRVSAGGDRLADEAVDRDGHDVAGCHGLGRVNPHHRDVPCGVMSGL